MLSNLSSLSTGLRRLTAAAALAIATSAPVHSASAGNPAPSSLLDLPLATADPSPKAVTIIAETPLNRYARFKCNSANTSCFARLPVVPAGERWQIQFVSCKFGTGVNGTLQHFYLLVTDANVTKQRGFHYLAPAFQAPIVPTSEPHPAHLYIVSQPMVLTVAAGNILHLGGTAIGPLGVDGCALSGARQRLG